MFHDALYTSDELEPGHAFATTASQLLLHVSAQHRNNRDATIRIRHNEHNYALPLATHVPDTQVSDDEHTTFAHGSDAVVSSSDNKPTFVTTADVCPCARLAVSRVAALLLANAIAPPEVDTPAGADEFTLTGVTPSDPTPHRAELPYTSYT